MSRPLASVKHGNLIATEFKVLYYDKILSAFFGLNWGYADFVTLLLQAIGKLSVVLRRTAVLSPP